MRSTAFTFCIILFLFVGCKKDSHLSIDSAMTASMLEGSESVQLVLTTDDYFPTPGYVIKGKQTTKSGRECVKLSHIYKNADFTTQITSPAIGYFDAEVVAEQKFLIKYKNKEANLVIRYANGVFIIQSDNPSFVHPL